mmetsp:Transcript_15313/g.30105  ORF Transcript_15313/g.30105 Transcript_15313/m.30105 type:complete len:669 (-) Transcript_15313:225-2231(-)
MSFFVMLRVALPLSCLPVALSCTALAIDGSASADGSAYAVENTDCNLCDFRLLYVPPRNHPSGAMRPIYTNQAVYPRGGNKGSMPRDPWAHIPEVPHTYGYWESINPLMNDQGLGMGESSCGALLQNKPPGSSETRDAPEGILDAMSILELALQRCATASCAVDLIGELVETYGYLPYVGEPEDANVNGTQIAWGDSGEAYTIADKSGEAWVVNVIGGVSNVTKSVWAAQRVPKGHVAIVANEFTMGNLPARPNHEFRFNSKIREAARVAGLWQGNDEDPIHFTYVFAPDPVLYVSAAASPGSMVEPRENTHRWEPPIPMYQSTRRWGLYHLLAPSQNISMKQDQRKYPFSVPTDKKVTHRDVMELMRFHYQGTEFDMSKGILAGPYETPYRVEGGPKQIGQPPRGVTVLRTLYSSIAQTGAGGSTLWYAPDSPLTSVYVPIDASTGADGVAETLRLGQHKKFDRKAAWWAFDFVNNWMQLNYKGMSTEDVYPRRDYWQDRIDTEFAQARMESGLGRWQASLQDALVADWWDLSDYLVMKWNDMSRTDDKSIDAQVGYPEWWSRLVGFSHDVHPVWVQPARSPPVDLHVPGYVAPEASLPRKWVWENENGRGHWTDFSSLGVVSDLAATQPPSSLLTAGTMAIALLVALALGYVAGQRQKLKADPLLG